MHKTIRNAYEITDAKISFVSLVDKAANKRQFLITKAENGKANFTSTGRIVKTDSATHHITGIVYEPLVEDSHGNYMTEAEITKAAYWFAKHGDQVDLQHSGGIGDRCVDIMLNHVRCERVPCLWPCDAAFFNAVGSLKRF